MCDQCAVFAPDGKIDMMAKLLPYLLDGLLNFTTLVG
jgi:hypothetical protein